MSTGTDSGEEKDEGLAIIMSADSGEPITLDIEISESTVPVVEVVSEAVSDDSKSEDTLSESPGTVIEVVSKAVAFELKVEEEPSEGPEEPPDEAKSPEKPPDEAETAIKCYARIRKRFPNWEDAIALTYTDNSVSNEGHQFHTRTKTTRFFHSVFGWNDDNNKVFKEMVLPMLENVVQGFPSVLIAYGQTGAGKTYSMLGAGSKQLGLLPQALAWLIGKDDRKQVILKGIEVYGLSTNKVHYFDLMDRKNASPDWQNKHPLRYLQEAKSLVIKDPNECSKIVKTAHQASHFAPTARNPQSSRGHIAFVASIRVDRRNTSFIVVDLAGSEGMDAIDCATLRRRPAQFELRKMEAGTIKNGLGELRDMVNELRRRKLEGRKGTGLRKLLHSYITGNTILAFLFAIAPSKMHTTATENTLRVADAASQIKKQVERALKGELTASELIAQLKAQLAVKNNEIKKLTEQLETLREVLTKKMQADIGARDVEIVALNERNAMLEHSLETVKRQQESVMEEEIIALTSQNNTLREKNQRQQEMIDKLNNESSASKDEFEAKIHEMEIHIESLETSLEMASEAIVVPVIEDLTATATIAEGDEMERAVAEAFKEAEENQRGFMQEAWGGFSDLSMLLSKSFTMRDKIKSISPFERVMNAVEKMFHKIDTKGNGKIGLRAFSSAIKGVFKLNWTNKEILKCFQLIDDDNQGSINWQKFQAMAEVSARQNLLFDVEEVLRRALLFKLGRTSLDPKADFCSDWLQYKRGAWNKYTFCWAECRVQQGMITLYRSNVDRDPLKVLDLKYAIVDRREEGDDASPTKFGVLLRTNKSVKFKTDRSVEKDVWLTIVETAAQCIDTEEKQEEGIRVFLQFNFLADSESAKEAKDTQMEFVFKETQVQVQQLRDKVAFNIGVEDPSTVKLVRGGVCLENKEYLTMNDEIRAVFEDMSTVQTTGRRNSTLRTSFFHARKSSASLRAKTSRILRLPSPSYK